VSARIAAPVDAAGLWRIAAVLVAVVGLTALSTPAVASAAPPTAALAPYVPLGSTAVRLVGYVNPNGEATTYRFQYGSDDCQLGGCVSVPAAGASAGQSGQPVKASVDVTGLETSTTYHFRLLATNPAGAFATSDATFQTLGLPTSNGGGGCPNEDVRLEQGATHLPECRAYELVSRFDPAERNGLDVAANTQRTRASADGDALSFSSTFGADGVDGIPGVAEYLSTRGPNGWSVHGITPPQRLLSLFDLFQGSLGYMGDLSEDLSKGIFLSNALLTAEGANVAGTKNLYLREDLRSPGAGTYRLLSDAVSPQSDEPRFRPYLAGTSADFSHMLFESPFSLLPETEGLGEGPKLYEWVDGVGQRLVGILPQAEGGGPTIAQAGRGAGRTFYTNHTLSRDGSLAIFTAPPFGSGRTGGTLYLRDDKGTATAVDDTTVRINATEKTNGSGPGGVDPAGSQPATFWEATPDLSRVFFTTTEALTDSASTEQPGVPKLYRYMTDALPGERLTLISVDEEPVDGIADAAEGAIGTSEDGSYVYFIGPNQLQAGGPIEPAQRIFVWHEGSIREVAAINEGEELERVLGANAWWGQAFEPTGKWARLTPDGRNLVFVSRGTNELTDYNHGDTCEDFFGFITRPCTQVYAYEASESGPGRLQCASCDQGRAEATGDGDFFFNPPSLLYGASSYLNRAQVAGGRLVAFSTSERLVPEDRNNRPDAYAFEAPTGEALLLSDGRSDADARFMDASVDGRDVFFATRAQLIPADRDENVDIYDARGDGGFAEARAQQRCDSADGCRTGIAATEPSSSPSESRPRRRHSSRCRNARDGRRGSARKRRRHCRRHGPGKQARGRSQDAPR
jgi:hypothetical protein